MTRVVSRFSVDVLSNGAVLVSVGDGEDYGRIPATVAAFEDKEKARSWLIAKVSEYFDKSFGAGSASA